MRIAIVGAGAAGISVLDALLELEFPIRLDITVYDPAEPIGPGRPYREDTEVVLLNQRGPLMSIRENDPEHFVRWVAGHPDPGISRYRHHGDFLPRALFGRYMLSCVDSALTVAREAGHRVEIVADTVCDIRVDGTVSSVLTAGGHERQHDVVVLCVGTPDPADLFGIAGAPGCVTDPYPLRYTVAEASPDAHVTVCGTGLTAIDIATALMEHGHQGHIALASRHGYLPSVRSPGLNPRPRLLVEAELLKRTDGASRITLADVAALALDELREFGIPTAVVVDEFRRRDEKPLARLRRHLRSAAEGRLWHALLINGLTEVVELAWSRFDDAERRYFLTRYHTVFMSLFSPIPPATAERIATALAAGQLSVHSGLAGVRLEAGGGFTVTTRSGDHHADTVFNAARHPTSGITGPARPVVDSLIAQGVARAHAFGGLDVDVDTYRLRGPSGAPRPGFYVLGQLTAGASYYTSSLYIISRCAMNIARAVLADVA